MCVRVFVGGVRISEGWCILWMRSPFYLYIIDILCLLECVCLFKVDVCLSALVLPYIDTFGWFYASYIPKNALGFAFAYLVITDIILDC